MSYLYRLCGFIPVVLALSAQALHTQPRVETIHPRSSVAQLRKVWEGTGGGGICGGFGKLAIPIPVPGSLYHRWMVVADDNDGCLESYVYRIDTTGATQQVSMEQRLPFGVRAPAIGRFRGGEQNYLIGNWPRPDSIHVRRQVISMYPITDTGVVSTPLQHWEPASGLRRDTTMELSSPESMRAADLDGDGDDELIILFRKSSTPRYSRNGIHTNSVVDPHPRIWIYRGGPDFTLDTPSVVLIDELPSLGSGPVPCRLEIGRFDNDTLLDVAIINEYEFTPTPYSTLMTLWLGSSGLLWERTFSSFDRRFGFPDAYERFSYDLTLLDLDGDNVLDMVVQSAENGKDGVPIYLSGSGKSIVTRPFTRADAELILICPTYLNPRNWGYVADSGQRYAMLGLTYPVQYGLRGGPNGPDAAWDAASDDIYVGSATIDLTGDGWSDLLGASGGSVAGDGGHATVYAGGPYIPRDTASSVRWYTAGRERGVAVWPNPVSDVLHIAWRGDLSHQPRRFTLYTSTGELIDTREIPSDRGTAELPCSEVSAGVYTCVVEDYCGAHVATFPVVIAH